MSKILSSQKDYIRFILNASDKQGKLLLKCATADQIRVIQEVCFNIVNRIITFSPAVTNSLYRYRSLIKALAAKNSLGSKLKLIKSKTKVILNILRQSGKYITSAL